MPPPPPSSAAAAAARFLRIHLILSQLARSDLAIVPLFPTTELVAAAAPPLFGGSLDRMAV